MRIASKLAAKRMVITVRFFAILKELTGHSQMSLTLEGSATVFDAKSALVSQFPAIESSIAKSAFAINREYGALDAPLHDGDELALIPPVSGG